MDLPDVLVTCESVYLIFIAQTVQLEFVPSPPLLSENLRHLLCQQIRARTGLTMLPLRYGSIHGRSVQDGQSPRYASTSRLIISGS